MKSLIAFREGFTDSDVIKVVIQPRTCRDSSRLDSVRKLYVESGLLFKDSALSVPLSIAEFNEWVAKCLTSFAKRAKTRDIKYAPCDIIIKAILSKVGNIGDFNKWASDNGVIDCFRFSCGLHRGYAAVSERDILNPLRTQTGYGLWYKTYYSTSFYWYNRLIIDLGKIDRLLQILS